MPNLEKLKELADFLEIEIPDLKGDKGDAGKDGRDGIDGKDGVGIKGEKGDKGDRGERGASGADGRDGSDGKDGKDAIIDEEKIIEEVVKRIPKPKDGKDGQDGRSTVVGGRISGSVKFYDLSAQTNGVLQVFSVPKSVSAVVFSSDSPIILMENNGFTLNASRTQLTLTTIPSQGSQLLFQYQSMFNT